MYTILVTEQNELVTSVKERIMQRSKLVDKLQILMDPDYKGHDMSTFTVMLEYLLPVSKEYKTEYLVLLDELYKDKLVYSLPFDTNLTREAGSIEIKLTCVKAELTAEGKSVQRVRKIGPGEIIITPLSAWSDIIADNALTALDQRLIQIDAMLNAANEMNQLIYETKADDITYDKTNKTIQLTANGSPIGQEISLADIGSGVISIQVDSENNLIVDYADGRHEIVGKLNGEYCTGIYIPSHSEDGMLTFTLSEEAGEPVYKFDIDKSNNWTEIETPESSSNYYWEQI